MPLPPPIIPAKRRVRRKRRSVETATPAPVGPTLVAAAYGGAELVLTFDRPVDASAVDGAAIVVDDAPVVGVRYDATGGATMDGPTVVRLGLGEIGAATGSDTTLTAGPTNGIVAVDGGAAWAGVVDVALPFGDGGE